MTLSCILLFISQIIPQKDALDKPFALPDLQGLIPPVDDADDDMAFIVRVIIIGIDDACRIQQTHLIFETERRTRIDLQDIILIDTTADTRRDPHALTSLKFDLHRRTEVITGRAFCRPFRDRDAFIKISLHIQEFFQVGIKLLTGDRLEFSDFHKIIVSNILRNENKYVIFNKR